MTPNTAATGTPEDAVVSRINATYHDWPLDVIEFRSSADVAEATTGWVDDGVPGRGDPPVAIAGLNILVTWGPRTAGREPSAPDAAKSAALDELVAAMEPLLSPLRARAVLPIRLASVPAASQDPGPSSAPEATPAP